MKNSYLKRERDFLLGNMSHGYIRICNDVIDHHNENISIILGYSERDIFPSLFSEIVFDLPNDELYADLLTKLSEFSNYELVLKGRHGERVITRCQASTDVCGEVKYVYLLLEDITIQHKYSEELMAQTSAFEYSPHFIVITDSEGKIENVNKSFTNKTQYRMQYLQGKSIFSFKKMKAPMTERFDVKDSLNIILRGSGFVGEFESQMATGYSFDEEVKVIPVYDRGVLKNIIFIGHDILSVKRQQKKIVDVAYHDQISGFLRRDIFNEIVENIKVETDEHKGSFGILYLELKDFGEINTCYGQQIGNMVLVDCSARLKSIFRHSDIVARVKDNEFIVVCPQSQSEIDLEKICMKIAYEMNDYKFNVEDELISLDMNIGALHYNANPPIKDSINYLIEQSKMTMRKAKDVLHKAYLVSTAA